MDLSFSQKKEEELMIIKYLVLLFLSITLTACSVENSQKSNVQDTSIEEKESQNEKQIDAKKDELDEESKKQLVNELTQLLKEKKYLEVIKRTIHGESELEQTFFNFALAKQSIEKRNYSDAYEFLDKIKNPPKEVPKEIVEEYRKLKIKLEDYKPVAEEQIQEEPVQEEPVQITDLEIGMTKEEVLKILGEPKDINKTITANGVSEQWVYFGDRYLYFEDGILTTIQDY
jgi:hypothetical protein